MKNHFRRLTLCATALPFLMFSASAQADVMTGDQIKAAASGKTFAYSSSRSGGTATFSSDGKLVINWKRQGKSGRKTGTWWIKDDKICSKYARGRTKKKTTACSTWNSLGDGKIKSSSGSTLTAR